MRLILLSLLLTLTLSANDKVALVIGNKNYTNHTGLNNPIKDAQLIRDTLRGMGFEVVEAYNKNLNGLSNKLDTFISKSRRAKIAVVYYAGHGIGVGTNNYLIPLGSSNLSVDNLGRKLMSVNELKGAVAKASGFGVVFFDACRNSLFSGRISGLTNRGSRALVQPTVSTTQNILVSFSTQVGSLAKDDVNNGNHSPYALALSESLLSNSNIDIRQMMGSVRSRVLGLTSNQQYPIDENQLQGEQYCLKGFCKQYGNDEENQRLKAEIARLRQQQTGRVDSSTNNPNIVTIDGLMYQNQLFTKEDDNNLGERSKGRVQNWSGAIQYCKDLTLGAYSDWRLPKKSELRKLLTKTQHRTASGDKLYIRAEFAKNFQKYGWAWSSTEKDSSSAWLVRFYNGLDYWGNKTYFSHALCVR